ncbi:MAG TPA: hypothetical protein PLO33_04440 [Kouleothrix sp.]|uniref:hypothetical protein n=1 Tax=Kouleothrix sp. TaxID=2779161 RepID=UPI002B9C454D|nr:hypothetical protein [Kouleothrix sp.]HRC74902.1 hypothetical protein [Kouleothrix sp.]
MLRTVWLKLLIVLALLLPAAALGHERPATSGLQSLPGRLVVLRASPHVSLTRVPPRFPPGRARVQTATINVTYTGFSPAAQAAFQYAVDIWSGRISSSVPIEVRAVWKPLDTGVLGSAGPATFFSGFPNAPAANTWYPVALANKLAGEDLAPGKEDIDANFSSVFPNWYFGTDGNTPAGEYDFVTVVLHELGHGLGFTGSMTVDSQGIGSWGDFGQGVPVRPLAYDRFGINGNSELLIDTNLFANPSAGLAAQLTSQNLFFNGANAIAANNNEPPQLYAPASWEQGSSFSHLDEATYPAGDPNSLMTPQFDMGESNHDPGPITLGIFTDIGWTVGPPPVLSPQVYTPVALLNAH